MKGKISAFIISGGILVVSIVILLTFLLLPNKKDKTILPLNCSANDISLNVGETITNFYSLSIEEANISFEVDKEGFIDINRDRIIGLEKGIVKVTITAKLDNYEITETFVVRVLSGDYTVEYNAIYNCNISSNVIYMTDNVASFSISFYDLQFNLIENPTISFVTSGDINFVCNFGVCQVVTETGGEITLTFEDYNYTTTLIIVK